MAKGKKVVVAMSGGVDSSVAAALLKREGFECVGVFMRLGEVGEKGEQATAGVLGRQESNAQELEACSPKKRQASLALHPGETKAKSHKQGCCSTNDAADARYVAGLLDIPFYALNFQHDFGGIIDYFVREYDSGRTPNPCVRCNEYLKFGKLARYAEAVGADYVATGHYARVRRDASGGATLLRGRDVTKDQSYVLFGVPRGELQRMMLPLGELEKSEVRRIAEELKLPVFNKPDSQEICFVPDNDYARLVRSRSQRGMTPGTFVDETGKVVGKHEGHQHFTIGQRKGLGVAMGHPVYVTAIDPATNTVTLGEKDALLQRTLIAREVNWLAGADVKGPGEAQRVWAKVRYNSPPAPAVALRTGEDELTVRFDEPVSAITPGQAVVCYGAADGDGAQAVLGGAWIDKVMA